MFKGEVNPQQAYDALTHNENAVLVDVRTRPEWTFVGLPAVGRLLTISWQEFPVMEVNPQFADAVEAAGVTKDADVYLICRSGQRSAAAAAHLTRAGFANCYNVAEGFEGDLDEERHRGRRNGWKARGLPWIQS